MPRRRKGPDPLMIVAQGIAALIGISVLAALRPGSGFNIRQLGDFVSLVTFGLLGLLLVLGLGWIAWCILSRILSGTVSKIPEDMPLVVDHVPSSPEQSKWIPLMDDDSRYMPKPVVTVEDDSRYMPKLVVAVEDNPRYQPKPTISLSQQLHSIDWFQFEKLVELAYSPTHKVTRRGGANPDGGIDLIIENAEGQTAVQCKHWKAWKVGVRNVRELIGAMTVEGLKKGIIVTIKGYSPEAANLARQHGIELVDEDGVLELLGVADQAAIQMILQDERKICPKCEREMVRRTASKGPNEGGQFWGCSGYPRCRFVMQV
jgi:hypothetical protein